METRSVKFDGLGSWGLIPFNCTIAQRGDGSCLFKSKCLLSADDFANRRLSWV